MTTSLRERILMKRRGRAKAAILWPLVLYSLAQMVPLLGPLSENSPHFQDGQLKLAASTAKLTHMTRGGDGGQEKLCSSSSDISASSLSSLQQPQSLLSSSAYLSSLLQFVSNQLNNGPPFILMADALRPELPENQTIIILNSTNFNTELIQYKHPFPHIKLIEYYVSFCGFCVKFKPTYTQLASEIYPWRTVIRTAVIDLGVSSNAPIAHPWSIATVPALRIHPPPPNSSLAERLDKQLASWSSKLSFSELQSSMFREYNSSNLVTRPLEVLQYMGNVALMKADLLRYIERYVRTNPSELPASWPNLRPVTEASLVELHHNHPRQELFLIIEGSPASDSDQSSSPSPSAAGLNVIMDLSSTMAWKAVRYVRASENQALVEDLIAQQKMIASEQEQEQATNQINEQVKLLQNLISSQPIEGNRIALAHIDNSHLTVKAGRSSTTYPYLTIVNSIDLTSTWRTQNNISRAKRDDGQDSYDKADDQLKIQMLASYINQTYTETSEDRDFLRALYRQDGIDSDETTSKKQLEVERYTRAQQVNLNNSLPPNKDQELDSVGHEEPSLMEKVQNIFSPSDKKHSLPMQSNSSDYQDKLKAIHYTLFTEIPRKSTIDMSLVEQQEKLNTLVNFITVIKSYFPFADSRSTQFIDEVQSYLIDQQSKLRLASSPDQGFDIRQFKQELKRLENQGKSLPEIKEWKFCGVGKYPCALWRLFHTLAAFEHKKLNQIRHQPSLPSSTSLRQSDNKSLSPSIEAITMKSNDLTGVGPSPVERLVSPPSTTTSLSLTIATPTSHQSTDSAGGIISGSNSNNNNKPLTEADLPMPVILVMRDYITSFFSCEECKKNFRTETADLSLEKIREQPAEFSIMWLWETHNRVNKRLSVDPDPRPKVWFPTYQQCAKCYKKPPSFLKDTTVDATTIFRESIEWNRSEVLSFLLCEYTRQPMDDHANLFGYQIPYDLVNYLVFACLLCLILAALSSCATYYIERQRRHKATLLNGSGAHYTLELR